MGGGGPSGVCGSSGVLLDRAGRRCTQTHRHADGRRLEDTSAASRASRAPPCLSESRAARAPLSPFHRNYFKNNKNLIMGKIAQGSISGVLRRLVFDCSAGYLTIVQVLFLIIVSWWFWEK